MINSNFLLESFDRRWEEYRANLSLCQLNFSEKAVHDLRVATRRLLAVLEISRNIVDKRGIKKLHLALKDQLDGFDDLRDVQVMLISVTDNVQNLPALMPFRAYLEKREKRLLRAAEKQVRNIKLTALNRRMLKVHDGLAVIPPAELPPQLFRTVDKTYRTVVRRYGWIDPDDPASIHRVRVVFKKFRYMLESIHPILTGFPESQFKRMHAYQTMMGDIQDAKVLLNMLSGFSRRHAELELGSVNQFYEQHLSRVLAIYLDKKGELDSFWRANPDAAQPWMASLNKEDGT